MVGIQNLLGQGDLYDMWAQEILAEWERVKEKTSGMLWGIYQEALKEGWSCQHKRKTEREAPHGPKARGKWGRVFSLVGKKGSAKKAADVAQGLGKAPHEPVGMEGATFIKRFQTGDFGGVVTKSYQGEDGLKWHRAVYDDGDAGEESGRVE